MFFSLEIKPFGTFRKEKIFYHYHPSFFARTTFGTFLTNSLHLFLNLFLTTIIGITLNIVSFCQYKRYIFKRKQREDTYQSMHRSQNWSNREILVRKRIKEMNERNVEKNMFFMALTLCSLLIMLRCTILISYILFFFFYSLHQTLISILLIYTILTLGPFSSTFIFYFFSFIRFVKR